MLPAVSAAAARVRIAFVRVFARFGFGEGSFLIVLAVLIGIVTAFAAVGFHELIELTRHLLYGTFAGEALYGQFLWLLILLPAFGGLVVGVTTRYIIRGREGHGIIDVLESVRKTSGVIRPSTALEKIFTSAVTIGSGGSAGAEGPIVQIGAAIASGFGQLFRVARPHLPILIGCGCAAGISAVFNSPIGGLLFTLEVILRDFSLRTITPVVIASVMANFTTATIFRQLLHQDYTAIFFIPRELLATPMGYEISHTGNFIVLGLICGLVGVTLSRLMHFTERRFAAINIPRALKPALGGALLGVLGVLYVLLIGHWLLERDKFIPFEQYAMPAFFGEGYGAVRPMLGPAFYHQFPWITLGAILLLICVLKIVGTCLTLGSGGSGGIIAPSLFLGAVAGGAFGLLVQNLGLSDTLAPHAYALIGMGAVLAAVVYAPLAAILILFDVTRNYDIVLPAMLTTIIATGAAQLISRDSIYTLSLRLRGIHVGTGSDLTLLRRLTVEEVKLDPAPVVHPTDPAQLLLDLTQRINATDFVVCDEDGNYTGMVTADDIKTALLQREAIPLLTVGELARNDVPIVRNVDDLASVLDKFSSHDVNRLPVCVSADGGRVVGLISRSALMRRYQRALSES